MKTLKYYAQIIYTIDKNHPDIKYIDGWEKGKIYTFEDVYTFNDNYGYTKEDIISHIKNDLKLVAGGGYNSKHIHNVKFNIKKI